jgi:protein SCO1
MRYTLLSFLLLAGVACSSFAAEKQEFKGGLFDPPRPAPDFLLKGSDGSELRLSRYRGKVIALGFGYTYCPDVCPTTLADLAQARKKLGTAAKEFQVVYVTVDPERDTPERLRNYLVVFDKTFVGATGTPEQLAQVRKAYGISAVKKTFAESSAGYLLHHSSFVYLIDPTGSLRGMIPFGSSVDDIVHDVKIFLRR